MAVDHESSGRDLSFQGPYGVLAPATHRSLRGIEIMEGVREGRFPQSPIAKLLNYEVVAVAEGTVTLEARPSELHLNFLGIVHGGFAATILDACMGCAIHTTLPAGRSYTTMELKISYLRPITAVGGVVTAVGTVLRTGQSAGFADGRLVDSSGRLLAHGTTTCLVRAAA